MKNSVNNKILEAINRGIQFALDDFNDEVQDSPRKELIKPRNQIKDYLNDYKRWFIDLGLPSGTLWMAYNLGVNPDKLSKLNDWNGKWYTMTSKFSSKESKSHLYYKNDNDFLKFSNIYNAKIPTEEQCKELFKYCEVWHKENYNDIDKLNVIKLKSKINGKILVIPYSGVWIDNINDNDYVKQMTISAFIWSSTYTRSQSYKVLHFNDDFHGMDFQPPYNGCSMRLVINKI